MSNNLFNAHENLRPLFPKLLYTVKETAEILNVGKTKLYSLVASGRILMTKIDGKSLFTLDDILDFLDSLKQNDKTKEEN